MDSLEAAPPEPSTIVTQWGTTAIPFRTLSATERQALLRSASTLARQITQATGIEVFLSYGCLLGAVRSGTLISHDFDVDLVFVLPEAKHETAASTVASLAGYLISTGLRVASESNGQLKVSGSLEGVNFQLELFACWVDGDRFFQYFAVRGSQIVDDIFPLGAVEIEGVPFPAPRNPERLLEAIYGPSWRVPNPDFRYELTEADWRPFAFLFTRTNIDFWDNYYAGGAAIAKVWLDAPSAFAEHVAERSSSRGDLLELGCGNGRDGLYFASLGFQVTLADYSQSALKHCAAEASRRGLTVRLERLDVADVADCHRLAVDLSARFDIVYARFFLHAISEVAQWSALKLASQVLKAGGHLCIEYRAIEPEEVESTPLQYENGAHYRRLIHPNELEEEALRCGLTLEHRTVGRGLAKYRSEDPLIARQIFIR